MEQLTTAEHCSVNSVLEHHVVEQSGIRASVRLTQLCHQMLLL